MTIKRFMSPYNWVIYPLSHPQVENQQQKKVKGEVDRLICSVILKDQWKHLYNSLPLLWILPLQQAPAIISNLFEMDKLSSKNRWILPYRASIKGHSLIRFQKRYRKAGWYGKWKWYKTVNSPFISFLSSILV